MRGYENVPSDELDDENSSVDDASSSGDDIELTSMDNAAAPPQEDDPEDFGGVARIPLELQQKQAAQSSVNRWDDPWLLHVYVLSLSLSITSITVGIGLCVHLTGRLWTSTILALHMLVTLILSKQLIPKEIHVLTTETTTDSGVSAADRGRTISMVLLLLFEAAFFLVGYPIVLRGITEFLWTDDDGSIDYDWELYHKLCRAGLGVGHSIVASRILLLIIPRFLQCWKYYSTLEDESLTYDYDNWHPTFWVPISKSIQSTKVREFSRKFMCTLFTLAILLNIACGLSAWSHFGPWPVDLMLTKPDPDQCHPFDDTECILPYPSFRYLAADAHTTTGWRIQIDSKQLPPLRGGIPIHPGFLNELDGFSTMAPMLFYMDGLKEAHEHYMKNKYNNQDNTSSGRSTTPKLVGLEHIEQSLTSDSITLLLDVANEELVAHSAQIDYLDDERPVVMVFPASPLRHDTHYALAVVNAHDAFGNLLRPTKGFDQFFHQSHSSPERQRYLGKVIPSLESAAPWFEYHKDPQALQLLFDFHTISAESQLGSVRSVRDATLQHLDESKWVSGHSGWNWKEHARAVRVQDHSCHSTKIARTIYAELDVPWFLEGRGDRSSILDAEAVKSRTPVRLGKVKCTILIPCSLRDGALGRADGTQLKAVVEYGHGLFGSRSEVQHEFLADLANDNGYILTAMDWRGMSRLDLLVVMKTMIGTPRLFQAVRDNLIQGYANKFALQHFSREALHDMEWMHFEGSKIPTYHAKAPTQAFYGISQGGILGGGYVGLSGPTKLIDRAVLGSPGTPFALILTRSLDFNDYDKLLMMNFYNNRHVRIFLSLAQSGWDSLETAGVLAPPLTEHPPNVLIQTGLGDVEVPTCAAESLARAYGAVTLSTNPRLPYGIQAKEVDSFGPVDDSEDEEHVAIFTEVLYQRDYESLPLDNLQSVPDNSVHWCVRQDPAMMKQVSNFISTGTIIDPCADDGCERTSSAC